VVYPAANRQRLKRLPFPLPVTASLERAELAENVSFILYLIPLAASVVYALSGWVGQGLSAALPESVYLTVTKDPYLFLLGFASICFAILIEVYGSPKEAKPDKLAANARQIQILAIVCIVSAVASVWSATGYSPSTGQILQLLLEGRYALIYPLMLFALAFFLNPSISISLLSRGNIRRNGSLIFLIASPFVLYGLWSIHATWIAIIVPTLVSLLAGLVLLVYGDLGQE
jgi:hypothetical protein